MRALLVASQLIAAAEGEHKQLQIGDLLVYLAIIAAALFFVVIAGLGYFSTGAGDKND